MKLCNSFVMLAARVALGVILIAQGWQKFSESTVAVAGLMLAAGPGIRSLDQLPFSKKAKVAK
ncbi:hypothetical protein ACKFRS_01975 [Corynebacterium tuberculostearicum]